MGVLKNLQIKAHEGNREAQTIIANLQKTKKKQTMEREQLEYILEEYEKLVERLSEELDILPQDVKIVIGKIDE